MFLDSFGGWQATKTRMIVMRELLRQSAKTDNGSVCQRSPLYPFAEEFTKNKSFGINAVTREESM